ncbi:hypothetical protein N7490_008786 [Penicillium lividum]|nr:hypothetical protein N7490_008786 [Penicillium lividum]
MATFERKVAAMNEPVDGPQAFIKNVLPLYHGPRVKIRIGKSGPDHEVSLDLLCQKSQYFESMFKGEFNEAKSDAIVIEKTKGVVSERSFNALLQWLYIEKVIFTSKKPSDQISEILEFVRFADMCHVTGLEAQMADLITNTLRAFEKTLPDMADNYYFDTILLEHIQSVNMLPAGHAVRRAIARASVRSFLTDDHNKYFKFTNDISRVPNFAADLLQEVQCMLKTSRFQRNCFSFNDPINESKVAVHRIVEKK